MKRGIILGALTVLFTLAASGSYAYVRPHQHELKSNFPSIRIKEHVIRLSVTEKQGAEKSIINNQIFRDEISDSIRIISGLIPFNIKDTRSSPLEELRQQARNYIRDNPEVFGVDVADVKLDSSSVYMGKKVQFLKFLVYRNGLKIKDARIHFRFNSGNLVQIINESFSEASAASEMVKTSLEKAAMEATHTDEFEEGELLYRVALAPDAKSYQLVKVRSFATPALHGGSWLTQVATATGDVFELKSSHTNYEAQVKGQVHERWYNQPLVTKPLRFLKVSTDQGSLFTDELGRISRNLTRAPSINGLWGKLVNIKSKKGEDLSYTGILNGEKWLINLEKPGNDSPWLDPYIAQLMVYHDVNRINLYAKRYIQHSWLDRSLLANVNLPRTCNAHWDGRSINLYSGNSRCGNTGLISDVIYHEWGHGLDAKTGGIDDGAFSEGYGDILSMIMNRSSALGIGFKLPNHEPVRDLAPDKIYPRDRGEVHAEGLIIGSTFWDLYERLKSIYGDDEAIEIISNYAFKMIFTADRYTQVYQALLAIDDNDGDLTNGTPNLCTLNMVFAKHGLANESMACKLASIENFEILDSDGDQIIEPGEKVKLKLYAKNSGFEALTDLKGELNFVDAEHVTLGNNLLTWDSIAAGETLVSNQAVSFHVSEEAVCGTSLKAKVNLSSSNKQGTIFKTFQLGRNQGTAKNYNANDLPAPIEDRQTTTSSVEVEGDLWKSDTEVQKAHLKFDITHTYQGDLIIKLISPDKSVFDIYKGRGSSDDVHLDKDITDIVKGVKGAGVWTLSVYDKANRDQGRLDTFTLTLTPKSFICD